MYRRRRYNKNRKKQETYASAPRARERSNHIMSIFEDTVLGVKDLGTSVSKKAGDLIDVSRLKVSAAELRKEIGKRYEALGRIVYDSKKSGTEIDGIVSECAASIDALYSRLDEVNKKIADRQNKVYCPACGAMVDKKALYCSRCGQRLEPPTKKKKDSGAKAEQDK